MEVTLDIPDRAWFELVMSSHTYDISPEEMLTKKIVDWTEGGDF